MRSLLPTLLRAGGGRRAAVVVVATAVATGVLLAAGALVMLWFDGAEHEVVSADQDGYLTFAPATNDIVADPDTRVGVLFGALVLVVPPLLLLDQAVRLGTTSRTRRDAALRLAGATRGDVRRLSAIEVAAPAVTGAVLGVPAFLLLRAVLSPSGFLPASAFPPAWWVLGAVVVVGLVGAAVGVRAGVADPLATSRGSSGRTSLGWWGPAAFVAGAAAYLYAVLGYGAELADVAAFVGLGLIVVGLVGCAPWVAHLVARRAESRARSAADLLAARRVLVAPGAAGRAAAGIAAVGLAVGASCVFAADILAMGYWDEGGGTYDDGVLATVVAALLALVVLAGSLAVHAVESLWESRRELATLVAGGTPQAVLDQALVSQLRLVAVPLGLVGAVVGGAGYAAIGGRGPLELGAAAVGVVLTWLAVRSAAWTAARAVRPTARASADLAHLRTE